MWKKMYILELCFTLYLELEFEIENIAGFTRKLPNLLKYEKFYSNFAAFITLITKVS